MKRLLSTTVLVLTMTFSGAALANSDWYGKEGQDEKPSYMNTALAKLPAKKAAEFRNTMKELHEDNKVFQAQLYKLHGDLHNILTAPTFDKEAFLEKRAEVQQVHDRMETNRTEAFAAAVSELSQNQRITLTRALHQDRSIRKKRSITHTQNSATPQGESINSIKR